MKTGAILHALAGCILAVPTLGSAEPSDYRFIECPLESRKTIRKGKELQGISQGEIPKGLPVIAKAPSGTSTDTFEVQETKCQVIRVAGNSMRGEVVYSATFDWTTYLNVAPVVLLDGLSLSESAIALLIVDNGKPLAPVVVLKLEKKDGSWQIRARKEVATMYINYLSKNDRDRLIYDLIPQEGADVVKVVGKRQSTGKVESDVEIQLTD